MPPPGERPLDDGSCQPAGIGANGCAAGFDHDDDRGCAPVLPGEACPPGLMATPGDTKCHQLAECGEDTWGDIPTDSNTAHVDQAYAGGDSDGTAARPWTTIQEGVDAASSGDVVALAAGSYQEDVQIAGKAVRLWGRCPELTEIVGSSAELAALRVGSAGTGCEIHTLAVRGDAIGVLVHSSLEVHLDRLWIHDNASRGLNIEAHAGPTSVTIDGSLLEGNHDIGVFVSGAEVAFDSVVIRDTEPNAQGQTGRGISSSPNASTGLAPTLSLIRCLIDHNQDVGLLAAGATTAVEATVVQDTQLSGSGLDGRGIATQPGPGAEPSALSLSGVVVQRNLTNGIYASGTQAIFESVVVRDTSADGAGMGGRGITVQNSDNGGASSALTLRNSLVARNQEAGVYAASSPIELESVVVRDTGVNGQGQGRRGVNAEAIVNRPDPSPVILTYSPIDHNHEMGVALLGVDGWIEGSLIGNTLANDDGSFGDAALFANWHLPSNATVTQCRLETSARASVSVFGAAVDLQSSDFICQAFDFDAETFDGVTADLEDLGENRCSCESQDHACKLVSVGLEPPAPLDSP